MNSQCEAMRVCILKMNCEWNMEYRSSRSGGGGGHATNTTNNEFNSRVRYSVCVFSRSKACIRFGWWWWRRRSLHMFNCSTLSNKRSAQFMEQSVFSMHNTMHLFISCKSQSLAPSLPPSHSLALALALTSLSFYSHWHHSHPGPTYSRISPLFCSGTFCQNLSVYTCNNAVASQSFTKHTSTMSSPLMMNAEFSQHGLVLGASSPLLDYFYTFFWQNLSRIRGICAIWDCNFSAIHKVPCHGVASDAMHIWARTMQRANDIANCWTLNQMAQPIVSLGCQRQRNDHDMCQVFGKVFCALLKLERTRSAQNNFKCRIYNHFCGNGIGSFGCESVELWFLVDNKMHTNAITISIRRRWPNWMSSHTSETQDCVPKHLLANYKHVFEMRKSYCCPSGNALAEDSASSFSLLSTQTENFRCSAI